MTVAPTEARIERAEIGGVPVFWADVPGPQHVSLVFRCGRADETLATAGLTHLVEHLALFALGEDQRRWGGFVDHVRTAFFMSGSLSELAEFVTGVSQALSALPLERLEVEKRILLTEAASAGHSAVQRLMRLRFGAKGFGLVEYQELGLHRADADEVANWSLERFAAENAAIWLSGRPPATLDLQLPSGRRLAPPAPAAIRGLQLPAYVAAGGGEGVLISFVATRSTALTVALSLLEQRLYQSLRQRRGLSYDACATYLPLTRDLAHLTLGADCLDEHAVSVRDQMLEELSRLADDGPGSAELTAVTDSRLARWSDHPSVLFAELDMAVSNELMSAPDLSREELQEELRELTPDAVAQAVREIRPTALLFAPTGESPPTGFGPYATGDTPPLPGRRYRRRGRRVGNLPKRSRIIASSEGITYLRDAPERPLTVHFHEVAAVVELGPGRVVVVAENGDWIRLDTKAMLKGRTLEREIEDNVPRELFIPFEDSAAGTVVDLARQKLGFRTRVFVAVGLLPNHLEPGERVLTLAAAFYRRRRGLLALTDKRLLFLTSANGRIRARRPPQLFEWSLAAVTHARRGRLELFARSLAIIASGKRHRFSRLTPTERAAEFVQGLESPASPTITPQALDTSLQGRLVDYSSGLVLCLIGQILLFAHPLAALISWMGCLQLLRTYVGRKRRNRAQHES